MKNIFSKERKTHKKTKTLIICSVPFKPFYSGVHKFKECSSLIVMWLKIFPGALDLIQGGTDPCPYPFPRGI